MIAALCLNREGDLVATASEKGTLIRLTNALNGLVLYEFRRGSDAADISQLIFDKNTTKIAVASSNKQTIHIFIVVKEGEKQNAKKSSFLGKMFKSSTFLNSETSFCQFRLKDISVDNKSVCGFSNDGNQLLVV